MILRSEKTWVLGFVAGTGDGKRRCEIRPFGFRQVFGVDNFIQAFYKDKSLRMEFEDLVDPNLLLTLQNNNEVIYVSAEEFID